jgi:hypothetical protein
VNGADSARRSGVILFKSCFCQPLFSKCTSQIDLAYEKLEQDRQNRGESPLHHAIGRHEHFVPTSSSATIGGVVSEQDLQSLLALIGSFAAAAWIREELKFGIVADLDQSWVRRQYAPQNYPRWHAPHGWHQDGALKFDFAAYPDGKFPPDAILPMVTCWIALNACGVDAPGLELVSTRLGELLSPTQLTEQAVRARFRTDECWTPALEPGDALLFRGDILHRTHVTPAMTNDRTSIELRFFPADSVPARLAGDRFLPLD